MNNKIKLRILPLFFLMSLPVMAEEYRTFGQMSAEEMQTVNEAKYNYGECMNEFAMSQLEQQTDPRVIADHSMKSCAPILEELHNFFVSNNFDPNFSKNFIRRVSNREANKLLSNLMMFMATKNQ